MGLAAASASCRQTATLVFIEEDDDDFDLLANDAPAKRKPDLVGEVTGESIEALIAVGIHGDLVDQGIQGRFANVNSLTVRATCVIAGNFGKEVLRCLQSLRP